MLGDLKRRTLNYERVLAKAVREGLALPQPPRDWTYKAATCQEDIFTLQSISSRNSKTFVEIVKTRQVAVGPLEYCAVGQRICNGGPKGRKNFQ